MLIILHCVFDFLSVVFVFVYLWAYCEAMTVWMEGGGGVRHSLFIKNLAHYPSH